MKILTLTQNVTDIDSLNKGITEVINLTAAIGLLLEFTQSITTKQFSSISFTYGSTTGYQVNPIEIFQEAQATGLPHDIDLLVYDWTKIIPQPTNPTEAGINMQIPIQWFDPSAAIPPEDVFAEYFLHELSHYFFQKTGKTDITHLLTDGNLEIAYPDLYNQYKNTPIKWYLYLIKGLYTAPEAPQTNVMPEVVLTHKSDDNTQILGDLSTTGFQCKSLERSYKNNQPNISAIPSGTYLCQWKFKFNSLAYHYQVMNVPNRSGIFIHAGNYFFDSAGCILLGTGYANLNSDKEVDIINSKITIKQFETLMNKKDFTLVIK